LKFALVNPNWKFEGSIYFGCREYHLPLEYGYAKALLEREGHEVLLLDAHLDCLDLKEIRQRLWAFHPDFTVITTAPTYLFWRCPPPELRVPQQTVREIQDVGGIIVAVGPHASTTPEATLRKLGADVAVLGEFEEVLPRVAQGIERCAGEASSICFQRDASIHARSIPNECTMHELPALRWPQEVIDKHRHHHHRFHAAPLGPGAEMETSRGCPYRCVFCAKEKFRNRYRSRPLAVILDELDGLLAQGVEYVYFIDELFLPRRELLEAMIDRNVKFGVQSRIDLWSPEMLELLGRAGCVSIEVGVESISETGRRLLSKRCKLAFGELTERLIFAKKHIAFVQANLIATRTDDPRAVENWRKVLLRHGVWANKPVPLFPYPGSPIYERTWGLADDHAWGRALDHYLQTYTELSDIQEQQPLSLSQLELRSCR